MADNKQLDPSITQAQAKPFATMGAPGTPIYGGYIVEGERDARLSGLEKYRTYSTILANTAIVAAGVRYFLNLVGKANWRVEPADSSEEAETIADTIADIMVDMETPWHRVVRRAAMYRFYGFSLQEWTAKRRRDGQIGMQDIAPRPQRTVEQWDVSPTGSLLGVVQRSPQTMQPLYLPRGKLIYLVDDSLDDSPQGLGLFRHIAPKAEILARYEVLEGWGFERDLRGTPIGRGPLAEMAQMLNSGNLTEEQVRALREPIEQFVKNALKGKDTGLVIDSAVYRGTGDSQTPSTVPQWSVELLQGSSNSQPDMARAIERLNREMARILGVEHLLLGADSSGSFALSKDKTQSFGMIVTSTLQEIKESFEADFLTPLFDLNGWDPSFWPTLKVEQIQFRDIEQITGALADLAQAGAALSPADPAVNEVRDMLGLSSVPEIEQEDSGEVSPEEGGDEGMVRLPDEEDASPDVSEPSELSKAASYQPPSGAKGNAARVLRWKRLHGSAVKGMTPVGWARARQLASGRPVGRDTVSRMAQFNRHRKNAVVDPKYKAEPWRDAGYVAWLGWGGDTGINWAIRTMKAEKDN